MELEEFKNTLREKRKELIDNFRGFYAYMEKADSVEGKDEDVTAVLMVEALALNKVFKEIEES